MFIASILVLHRYLGVALGVLMTLWCVSGFAMMYQSFPSTTSAERLAGLAPLNLSMCCAWDKAPLADEDPVGPLEIEMLDGRAVARIGAGHDMLLFNLNNGAPRGELDEAGARRVAEHFAAANHMPGAARISALPEPDQWTVALFRRQAPLWKSTLGEDNGYVYVSALSGKVVQDASARERFLSWIGAIPHWLYPTLLRQNVPLWTEIVIWSSALGVFLTVTGIFIGIVKLRGRSGRWFPYRRPMWFLHHVLGFFVGVFVLTWTFSGLLTMQPWNLFTSESRFSPAALTGEMTWKDTRALIEAARPQIAGGDVVQVRAAPLLGAPYLVLQHADGKRTRIGADGDVAALNAADVEKALNADAAFAGAHAALLTKEDAYYYSHHNEIALPAIRITLADATRIYLDAATGEIARVADATAKRYRWLESGLHSLDFPVLRQRPIWDFVVLPLLLAVTAACATGAWLSFMRIGRDVTRLKAYLRGRDKSAE